MTENNEKKIQIGAILAGINVILIGLYLLLGMTGVLLFSYLPALLKLWPIILIAIGLDIIFRSFAIKYVGSVVMTIFIILAMVASVPGTTGTGVRKVFGMPEEPVGWNLDRIIKTWVNDSGMKVVETVEENRAIAFIPTKFVVNPEGNVKNLYVTIKKGEIPSCRIKTEILDSVALYEVNPPMQPVAKNENDKEKVFNIDRIDSKGKFCNVYIEAAFADTINIEINANLRKFEIVDNWVGDVNLGTATNCDIKTGNVGEFRINSASGSILIGNCKKADINTLSADVKTGNLSDSSTIKTASGSIEVNNANNVGLRTISGNITLAGAKGKVMLGTVSGEITSNLFPGITTLSAETTSGNITISDMQSIEKAVLKSVSGSVEVKLAKEASLTVNVDTLSGHTDVEGKEKMPEPGFDRSIIIGTGKGVLEIGTTSGNIEVK